MRLLRVLLSTGIVLALTSTASAAPIPFNGGLLDGVLRTYRLVQPTTFPGLVDPVILRDYTLGTDFYPAVPLSFLNSDTPYSRCVQDGINYAVLNNPPPCLSFFFQVTTELFGQGELRDGCTFIASVPDSPPGRPIMVARGVCSFSQKWEFAESQGWGGVMVVNDAAGPVAPFAIVPNPNFEPTIAFMRLTKDVGDQIRADWNAGTLAVEMSVSWTPNPVTTAAPEPGTLALMAVGLAAGHRWRRRRVTGGR